MPTGKAMTFIKTFGEDDKKKLMRLIRFFNMLSMRWYDGDGVSRRCSDYRCKRNITKSVFEESSKKSSDDFFDCPFLCYLHIPKCKLKTSRGCVDFKLCPSCWNTYCIQCFEGCICDV